MKTIIILITLFISQFSFSQTKLDSLVMNEVNKVRDSIGVTNLTFSKDLFLKSDKNTKVIKQTGKVGHFSTETNNFPSGEICNFVPTKVSKDCDSLKNIAKSIVSSWKSSPEHWEILTDPRWKFIGGSSLVVSQPYFCGKNMKYYDTYSSINFK